MRESVFAGLVVGLQENSNAAYVALCSGFLRTVAVYRLYKVVCDTLQVVLMMVATLLLQAV